MDLKCIIKRDRIYMIVQCSIGDQKRMEGLKWWL